MFGCRTSGASMPRNSTMSGFGGTEKIKDARPLHDKAFVQQCIRQLHEVKKKKETFLNYFVFINICIIFDVCILEKYKTNRHKFAKP